VFHRRDAEGAEKIIFSLPGDGGKEKASAPAGQSFI